MLLFHATLRRNLRSIRAKGLDPAYARGKLRSVWLHTAARTPWALLHTVRRHGGSVRDVVVIPVRVPRCLLRRYARGLWHCPAVIPPDAFGAVIGFRVVSASEVVS